MPRPPKSLNSLQDNDLEAENNLDAPATGPRTREICKSEPVTGRWPAALAAGAATIAVTWPILRNELALDDIPVILGDPRYPDWSALPQAFVLPYWPPPFVPDLFRPLTTLILQSQRLVSGDPAFVVHLVSLILATLVSMALAWWLVPRTGAVVAGLIGVLFAVHPVHTEAVASGVNQAEVIVAGLALLSVALWLRWRTAGDPTWRQIGTLAALQWCAAGFKESGVLVPAMVAAAEITLLADPRPWRARLTALRPAALALLLSTLAFVALRATILQDLRGSFQAPVFVDMPIGVRALTMLGMVPELVRLLVWPAHLRIEYSVGEFVAAHQFGQAQAAGLALLLGLLALLAVAWRRLPLAAFGLLLAGLAYGPVHNVLVPTGILVAERTLFLPSLGVLLAVAAVGQRLRAEPWSTQRAALAACGLLVVLGGARTVLRYFDWKDQRTLWERALVDSPDSWQTNATVAAFAERDGKLGTAERLLRRSIAVWPRHVGPRESLAHIYRQYGRCWAARELYLAVLKDVPDQFPSRLGLVTCELWNGDYKVARWAALGGVGYHPALFRRLARTADSALKVQAPAHTVVVPDSLLARVTEESRRALMTRAP